MQMTRVQACSTIPLPSLMKITSLRATTLSIVGSRWRTRTICFRLTLCQANPKTISPNPCSKDPLLRELHLRSQSGQDLRYLLDASLKRLMLAYSNDRTQRLLMRIYSTRTRRKRPLKSLIVEEIKLFSSKK